VLLHDHLDGGLRPTTVIELAREVGHTLPTTDPGELAQNLAVGHRDERPLLLVLAAAGPAGGVQDALEMLVSQRLVGEPPDDPDRVDRLPGLHFGPV